MIQKSFNEIVKGIINEIHSTIPEADTKEGTVIRDVFINPTADQIALMYQDMKVMELSQSILTAVGDDLDRLSQNYFVFRKKSTYAYGKVRFYVKKSNTNIKEISISQGTLVATTPTDTKEALQFQTTESIYLSQTQIQNLPVDSSSGLQFIELAATSAYAGSVYNIKMNTITQLIDTIENIAYVSNPYDFSGGADSESDNDLMNRVALSLTGNNIGTKDGYLAFVLSQKGVLDAKIVGAGDDIMFRDGGTINDDGVYVSGKGGMVDIYVRGTSNEEVSYDYMITTAYATGDYAYSDVILPKQPVNNILYIASSSPIKASTTSVVSNATNSSTINYKFVNADDYEMEKGSHVDASGNTIIDVKYYQDIAWDFNITNTFPDLDYYSIPNGLNPMQIQLLKQQVDNELKNALDYMSEMIYSLNWSLTYQKSDSSGYTDLFDKIFYNDLVFKIVARDNRLDGRTFVKKGGKIYLRVYVQPDYVLIKDMTPTGSSVQATDKIHWLNGGSKPNIDDTITVKYNVDQMVNTLQTGIDQKKPLTADVLIKQTKSIPIEVYVETTCTSSNDPTNMQKVVSNAIVNFINNISRLGGSFDRSDIVQVVKDIEGIDAVNIDNIKISIVGQSAQRSITIASNEYFTAKNIVADVYSSSAVTI